MAFIINYTQADLDAITKAIASGQRKVRLNNREVEYHSIEQMLKAKTDIVKALEEACIADGTMKRRKRGFRTRHCSGL